MDLVSVFNSKKRRQRNSANDTKPTCCSDFCIHRCSLPHVPEEGALGGNTKCRSATLSSLVRERTRSCLASWMMKIADDKIGSMTNVNEGH